MPTYPALQARRQRALTGWRRLEWWAAGIALGLQSSALIPLLVMGRTDQLSLAQMAQLRLISLPVYLITIVLLSRNLLPTLVAVRRNLFLAGLMLLPVVSTLWSVSPSISLRRAVALMLSMLLGYLLAVRFTPRQLLLLVSIVVSACIGLSLLLAAIAPGLAFMPGESALRGAFTHKNGLGRIACLGTVLAAALFLDPDRRLRWFGMALAGPAVACLVLSQSATAMLSAGLGLVFTFFYLRLARRSGLGRLILVLVVIQAIGAFLFWLDFYLVPFLEAIGKDATLTGRVPLWAEVDREIAARFWTGYGYEAFWTPGNPELWHVWGSIGWAAPNAHNGWRDVLLGLGLPGGLLLAATVLRAIRQGAVLHCAAPNEGWLWLNVFVGMLLSINLTESSLLPPNDFFWILATAAIAAFSLHAPAVTASPS